MTETDWTISAEQEAFECLREELLPEHEGEFVVVYRGAVISHFPTFADAYADGLRRFGLDETFVVAEVAQRPPESVSLAWDHGVMFGI